MFDNFYAGKKVFITGDRGFKGNWLRTWLNKLGAITRGYDLKSGNDVRDLSNLLRKLEFFQPDIIFHLAAQPLVLKSYSDPQETFNTNIMGTVNVLECVKYLHNCRVVVNITTDKVFMNTDTGEPFKEHNALHGYDPYSMSKVCSELVTESYSHLLPDVLISTARAGNVIGGNDWSEYRIIPDIVKSINCNTLLEIRNPDAVRPFQHVLDCCAGYLLLAECMWKYDYQGAWNFGSDEVITVQKLIDLFEKHWKPIQKNYHNTYENLKESKVLLLDSSKSKRILGWKPKYNIEQAVIKAIEWYVNFSETNISVMENQIEEYE